MRTNIIPMVPGSTNTEDRPTNPFNRWRIVRGDGVGYTNDSSTGIDYILHIEAGHVRFADGSSVAIMRPACYGKRGGGGKS